MEINAQLWYFFNNIEVLFIIWFPYLNFKLTPKFNFIFWRLRTLLIFYVCYLELQTQISFWYVPIGIFFGLPCMSSSKLTGFEVQLAFILFCLQWHLQAFCHFWPRMYVIFWWVLVFGLSPADIEGEENVAAEMLQLQPHAKLLSHLFSRNIIFCETFAKWIQFCYKQLGIKAHYSC